MNKIKFSVFADMHHAPKSFMTNSYERLALIHKRADNENVDFIIQLGDLTHEPSKQMEFIEF